MVSWRRRICVLLIFVVVVIAVGVWFIFAGRRPMGEVSRVVLISIDTCRSDYLGCYGYPGKIAGNIDKLAAEGVLFRNVVSPVPLTLPAHSSMLTGAIPPYHGVHDNADYTFDESNVTIAEILKEQGFTTGAIIGAFVLDSQFGLDQGFDSYNDRFVDPLVVDPLAQNVTDERRGGEVTRFAQAWLEEHQHDEKFFLFLHYFDPHKKYHPPEPFATRFASNLYAGEIAYTDYCIGQVVWKLKELNLYDSTLIIVTSDHGEMLGEHGEMTHGYFIYQSAIKVPLIFKLPGRTKSRRIDGPVGIVDIVPTICAAIGVDMPAHVQGQDLSGYFVGKPPSNTGRYLYCESLSPTRYKAHSLLGVVTERFKYIQTARPELYDLVADPGESNNLIDEQLKRAHLLRGRLQEILDQSVREDSHTGQTPLDTETVKRLEGLGYVGGAIVKDFGFDPTRDDPKDLIQLHTMVANVNYLILDKEYAKVKVIADKVISLWPNLPDGYMIRGRIAFEQNNYSDAVDSLSRAVALDPTNFDAHNKLGGVLLYLERIDEAIEHFSESLRLKPDKSETRNNLGTVLVLKGRLDEAAELFAETIKQSPGMLETYFKLGNVLLKQDKVDEAVACFDDMLAVWPQRADLPAKAGSLFRKYGKVERAVEYWTKSLQLEPGQLAILNNLAWVKAVHPSDAIRNPAQAVALAQRACELVDYKNPLLLDTLSAAYAAAGRFAEAVSAAEKALSLAGESSELTDGIQKRLELYKASKPYRE